jgi:hypothetical protein
MNKLINEFPLSNRVRCPTHDNSHELQDQTEEIDEFLVLPGSGSRVV